MVPEGSREEPVDDSGLELYVHLSPAEVLTPACGHGLALVKPQAHPARLAQAVACRFGAGHGQGVKERLGQLHAQAQAALHRALAHGLGAADAKPRRGVGEGGVPEAMWIYEVKDFPLIVTMDAHGDSLHEDVKKGSKEILDELLGRKKPAA